MKLPNEKFAVAAREAKRRLENPLTKAQKVEKATVDAERLRKISWTANKNSERLRANAERRSAAGDEGLAAEASRLSTRRKSHPLTPDEKVTKARAEAERRSAARAELAAAQATRVSQRRKTNPLTVEEKAKKPWQMQSVIDNLGSLLMKKQKKLELRPKDGIRKVHKLQLFDYSICVIVMRLDLLRRLPINSVFVNASVSNMVLNVQP